MGLSDDRSPAAALSASSLPDEYAPSEISASDTEGMSELLEESQRNEADLSLEYRRQIAGLRAELGEQDERHRREMGDRTAEVEAARLLVGKNAFTAQVSARAEMAAALKDLESKAREVLQVRLQQSKAN